MDARGPGAPSGYILATGFGVTVAMWATAYVAMMQPGLVLGEVLFGLTLGWLLLGGVVAGRAAGAGARDGLLIGALSATLNLLLIGSLVGESSRETLVAAALWGAGTYAVSMLLVAAGAAAGRAWRRRAAVGTSPETLAQWRWYNGFVCVAAVAVFLLLITGGLVTGLEAGLDVPDWPNSFGHNMLLYPLSEMVGGVYYEHAHRLYGMLVGLTTITLAATLYRFDRRRWLHVLGIAVLVMVCVQGVLGGLRVTGRLTLSADPADLAPSTALAVVHGVFGQVVFATIVAIAAFTSATWLATRGPASGTSAGADRGASVGLVVLLLLQLVLGALYRHLNGIPDLTASAKHMILSGHLLLAGLVTIMIIFVGGRAWGRHVGRPVIPRLGVALLLLVSVQLLLGVVALVMVLLRGGEQPIPVIEVLFTTAHQAVGALLLASAVLLMVWMRKLVPGGAPARGDGVDATAATA